MGSVTADGLVAAGPFFTDMAGGVLCPQDLESPSPVLATHPSKAELSQYFSQSMILGSPFSNDQGTW